MLYFKSFFMEYVVMNEIIIFNGKSLNNSEQYGVQRYLNQILKEFDNLSKGMTVEVLIPRMQDSKLRYENLIIKEIKCRSKGRIGDLFWDHILFPNYVKKTGGLGVDLILSLPLRGCTVTAIHDCIPELFPQNKVGFVGKLGRWVYIYRVKKNIKNSKAIITVSNCTKQDIVRLYKCDPNKIHIIHNAWQHYADIHQEDVILEKYSLEKGNFFFSLGSAYYHKNFKWIVEAAKQNPQYKFIVTGTERLSASDRDIRSEPPKNILFTGYLQDGEIKSLMSNCKAFILPSLYEGFGIPPMEAMSCGARCIVSNTGSLPEIYGNSVWYIDPLKYDEINMDFIMSKKIEDNDVILNKYSWEKSAAELYHLLEQISKNNE